jgi:hypothetical protein
VDSLPLFASLHSRHNIFATPSEGGTAAGATATAATATAASLLRAGGQSFVVVVVVVVVVAVVAVAGSQAVSGEPMSAEDNFGGPPLQSCSLRSLKPAGHHTQSSATSTLQQFVQASCWPGCRSAAPRAHTNTTDPFNDSIAEPEICFYSAQVT